MVALVETAVREETVALAPWMVALQVTQVLTEQVAVEDLVVWQVHRGLVAPLKVVPFTTLAASRTQGARMTTTL
jgi:hypothetical protein